MCTLVYLHVPDLWDKRRDKRTSRFSVRFVLPASYCIELESMTSTTKSPFSACRIMSVAPALYLDGLRFGWVSPPDKGQTGAIVAILPHRSLSVAPNCKPAAASCGMVKSSRLVRFVCVLCPLSSCTLKLALFPPNRGCRNDTPLSSHIPDTVLIHYVLMRGHQSHHVAVIRACS